ncbi:hypothetical protein BPOR_0466g00090 [Botrytis porri]|uniref:Uncharacterized protein n=1 Tax=Botrytis porri TaxID=87229 RepID=A0A4Z1KF27_9HELO|nr:hypothetical protein BPOR_0466g00090 [Botrytis porri]
MREVIVHPSPEIWTEITEPGPDDVVIKVIVAGSNVRDDIAGIVYSIGTNMQIKNEYSLGERVAAFHPMMGSHGAYAEYAVAPIQTVMELPDAITFEVPYQIDDCCRSLIVS